MKKYFYDDTITAAMMFKHHGVKFDKNNHQHKTKPISQHALAIMGNQVSYNLELVRGDNEDFFDWVFRARSFYDSAVLLVYFLEHKLDLELIQRHFKSYTLGENGPVSIYPSFFYIASHSIELLLKGIAIFSGSTYKEVLASNHNIENLLDNINKSNFPLPTFTIGEKNILKNMSLVGTGLVRYPNNRSNTPDGYNIISKSILRDGKERLQNEHPHKSPVYKIISKNEDQCRVKELVAIMENSLNKDTYCRIWDKLHGTLEQEVLIWMQTEGAFIK